MKLYGITGAILDLPVRERATILGMMWLILATIERRLVTITRSWGQFLPWESFHDILRGAHRARPYYPWSEKYRYLGKEILYGTIGAYFHSF